MSYIDKIKKIQNEINQISVNTNLVIVTKNQDHNVINTLVDAGYNHFGENRIQTASKKWGHIISSIKSINLHLIGPIQSNKAKEAHRIFNYIHSLENEKVAKIFAGLDESGPKKLKYFIQVNIGDEPQKSGIKLEHASNFINFCVNDLKLNILGLMCIPPANCNPEQYFIKLRELNKLHGLKELSMGMSSDYHLALKNGATYIRIGSAIFN
jgi:pyridoxal phosphate enzyme (YggS family)